MSSLDIVRAGGPFVVAHRAGNDVRSLRRAESARATIVEADLHLFAGRIEVRHLKTFGPVPILWDRWQLAPPWAPRLLLDSLLHTAAPTTTLMLDLKGRDPKLTVRVAAALREHRRPLTVCCSQNWALLASMRDVADVRLVHSVGSARQLAALRKLAARQPLAGVSIHKRLLSRPRVADLRNRADLVMTWPVDTLDDARRLVGWGVDGLITEKYESLVPGLDRVPATDEAVA